MADNKKSFIFYTDWKQVFDLLTDEEAGKQIKHLLKYVNDEDPKHTDRVLEISFEPIKQQLKKDLKKYEAIKKKRSDSGRLGGKKSKTKQPKQMLNLLSKTKQNEANEADNVNGINIISLSNGETAVNFFSEKVLTAAGWVAEWFGITETRNFQTWKDIHHGLAIIENTGRLDNFIVAWKYYRDYHDLTGSHRHTVSKFMGEATQGCNGAWEAENWELKLKKYNEQQHNNRTGTGHGTGRNAGTAGRKGEDTAAVTPGKYDGTSFTLPPGDDNPGTGGS